MSSSLSALPCARTPHMSAPCAADLLRWSLAGGAWVTGSVGEDRRCAGGRKETALGAAAGQSSQHVRALAGRKWLLAGRKWLPEPGSSFLPTQKKLEQ